MEFSFVLPTLGDRTRLRCFLDSLERTTQRKDEIEVLFALDEGVTEVQKFVKMQNYSFDIHFYNRPLTDNFSDDYYNWLACRSKGRNIIAFNDDAWIRTHHWDVKIKDRIRRSGWSVYFVDIPDTKTDEMGYAFPNFPMVSRKAMNVCGFLLPPFIKMYPADEVLFKIYSNTGRILKVDDVLIQHDHVEESDPSKKRMLDIFLADQKKQGKINITPIVHKLILSGQDDCPVKETKLDRIMKIIKER